MKNKKSFGRRLVRSKLSRVYTKDAYLLVRARKARLPFFCQRPWNAVLFLPALPGRCCRWAPPAKPGAWGSPRRAYYRTTPLKGPRTVRPTALPTRGRPLTGRFTYALVFLLPVNGSINSFRLIWSAIWSSSSWCLMYSAICFLFHPTVST